MTTSDTTLADRAVRFISSLTLTGDYAGEPFVLRPFQEDFVRRMFATDEAGRRTVRQAFLALPRKQAKALALDTPLPTPTGWTTMGEVRVGDTLFDETGRPCTVVAATEYMHGHRCYRVSFSDGTSIVADAGHLWETRNPDRKPRVFTTEEIAGSLYRGKPRKSVVGGVAYENREFAHTLPPAPCLDTPEADLPVHPYVLGVWLGDGNSATSHFDDMGEMGGQHIPAAYLRASAEQRLSLLQGLMDSDGTASDKGQCCFDNTSKPLFDGFVELARSLGLKVTTQEKRATLDGKDCGPTYRASFYAYADDPPVFRLARKLARPKAPRGKTRKIVAVDPVPSVPVRCVQVDSPSRLYLAGEGMVPTHNSSLLAGVLLFLLFGTGRRGQRIYSASGSREQASILFDLAAAMIRDSDELSAVAEVHPYYRRIEFPGRDNKFEALASDADLKHGLNPSAVFFDEVHVFPDRRLHDVLTSGFATRRDPLTAYITTAGENKTSFCYELWRYAERVRDGEIDDPGFLPLIYAADPEADDWTDEATWFKAMPALGDFCDLDFIRAEFRKAQAQPSFENHFKQVYLNMWVDGGLSRWLRPSDWESCRADIDPADYAGRDCYAGLDLSTYDDLSAFVLIFPEEDGTLTLLPHFWLPCGGIVGKEQRDRVPYTAWSREGWLTLSEGDLIDKRDIFDHVVAASKRHNIIRLGADPAMFTGLGMDLKRAGINAMTYGQTKTYMNWPCREFERLIRTGGIRHDGNPVMAWNVENVRVHVDAGERISPAKAKERGRIDGISAAVTALGTMHAAEPEREESVYNHRGVLVI